MVVRWYLSNTYECITHATSLCVPQPPMSPGVHAPSLHFGLCTVQYTFKFLKVFEFRKKAFEQLFYFISLE